MLGLFVFNLIVMYCIIDTTNNTFVVGEFQQVIGKVFIWTIHDNNIVYYKARNHPVETYIINDNLSWITKEQKTTLICNYLWSIVDRYQYLKFRQVT